MSYDLICDMIASWNGAFWNVNFWGVINSTIFLIESDDIKEEYFSLYFAINKKVINNNYYF